MVSVTEGLDEEEMSCHMETMGSQGPLCHSHEHPHCDDMF